MKLKLTIFSLTVLSSIPLFAQFPPPPPATPIDGGLSALLLAGVAFGIKKIRDNK